jgi:phosphoadenosine phosphosulfate reductase
MNSLAVQGAVNLLHLVRRETDSIGVAVSFGKDSLVTLDLCCRIFRRVEGYYLYRVANLRIVEEWADNVRRRHNITVRMYPHFDLARCYRNSVLQPHWKTARKAPAVDWQDVERTFRADANVSWLAYGWRRNDSRSRAIILAQCGGIDYKSRRVYPLRIFRRQDVYDYLAARQIPLPPGLGRKDQGGLDFHPEALRELKEKYPDDWAKWLIDFPFAEVQLQKSPASQTPETEQSA